MDGIRAPATFEVSSAIGVESGTVALTCHALALPATLCMAGGHATIDGKLALSRDDPPGQPAAIQLSITTHVAALAITLHLTEAESLASLLLQQAAAGRA